MTLFRLPTLPRFAAFAPLLAGILLLAATAAEAQPRGGPSFNCRNAGTPTEYLICDNPELARLDRRMADLYYDLRARTPRSSRLKREQADWLAERDACRGNYGCVRSTYNARIGELSARLDGPGGGFPPAHGRPRPVPPAPGGPSAGQSVWDHNGSRMLWTSRGPERVVTYLEPRPGLGRAGIGDGTVLFEGRRIGDRLSGTAYTFGRGCPPAGYHVEGRVRSETNVVLRGAAPVRQRHGCRVVGYDPRSSNATLRFRYLHSTR